VAQVTGVPHLFAYLVSSPTPSLIPPSTRSLRGSVKDVPGRFVKDVMGLDMYSANEWALRTARVAQGRMATHDKEILIQLTNPLDRSHHPDNHCE